MTYPDIAHLLPDADAVVTVASAQFDREEDAHLEAILECIVDERFRQDQRWGGPEHDDGHPPPAWEDMIHKHAYRLVDCMKEPSPDYRERLIKVAALAVAAVQVWDRQHAATTAAGEA